MDEKTIRVLRDMAEAVQAGIGNAQEEDGGYPAWPAVVFEICSALVWRLDQHIPEYAERQKRLLAERAAREAAEDAAERAKAAE
jgi:hypothetical protein